MRLRRLTYEFASNQSLDLHQDLPTVTLRGAFGYSLLQILAWADYLPEMRDKVFLYKRIFHPDDLFDPEAGITAPRPFVLRGHFTRPDHKAVILEILLFGNVGPEEHFIDKVVANMGKRGLGDSHQICEVSKVGSEEISPVTPLGDQIQVDFLSPVRLRSKREGLDRDGKPLYCRKSIPFDILIARLLSRLESLARCYEPDWALPDLDRKDFILRAAEVQAQALDTRWHELSRVSSRTGHRAELDGLTGSMLYRGDLAPYRSLLAWLPWIHLGKSAAFGCGWASISSPAQTSPLPKFTAQNHNPQVDYGSPPSVELDLNDLFRENLHD